MSQLLYQLVLQHMTPMMMSGVQHIYSYLSSPSQTPHEHPDDEHELDLLQMDRLITWMGLMFKDTHPDTVDAVDSVDSVEKEPGQMHQSYKKELYNIYVTILSDYKQYSNWKKYNHSLWLLSSYRNKNTKALAHKIMADIRLFNEGLRMFSMFDAIHSFD